MALDRIYSYDIFDTLLVRVFFEPTDLFFFLGVHLKKIGLVDKKMSFEKVRIDSERKARLKSKKEEIDLVEIYEEFQKSTGLNQDVIDSIIENELCFEEFALSIIRINVEKLNNDSIIISDIYLGNGFMKELFKSKKLPYRKMFLSSEYGLMKHSSSLYKIVLKDELIDRNQMIHIGDNWHSDVSMAQKMGIQSNHFKISTPTRYERLIYNVKNDNRLESVFAGSMRASRLNKHFTTSHEQNIWNVATNVIGPFVFLYTYWVIEEAKSKNIKTLFFVARDGQIMYQVAEIINKYLKYDIELRYLYGSRKAFHLPSITEIGYAELNWIFDKTVHLSVDSVCSRVELESHPIKHLINEIGITNFKRNLSKVERVRLKNLFASNSFIHELILIKAQTKRTLVGKYLKQEGFGPDKEIAIVDIGWRGRQQKSLSKILDLVGLYPRNGLKGFYLSLRDQVIPYKLDEVFEYFTFQENSELILYHSLYEVFVSADHGSCSGYKSMGDQILPELREQKNSKMLNWGLKVHQNGIHVFSEMFMKTYDFLEIDGITQGKIFAKLLLGKFLKFPTNEEAMIFHEISIYEDQEEEVSYPLTQELNQKELIVSLIKPISIFHENSWREASFALSIKRGNHLFQKVYNIARMFSSFMHKHIDRF